MKCRDNKNKFKIRSNIVYGGPELDNLPFRQNITVMQRDYESIKEERKKLQNGRRTWEPKTWVKTSVKKKEESEVLSLKRVNLSLSLWLSLYMQMKQHKLAQYIKPRGMEAYLC